MLIRNIKNYIIHKRVIKKIIKEFKPDLVIVSHASNVCGLVAPVEEIFALAKKHSATTVVDMAQTAGLIILSKVENPEEYSTYFLRIDNVRFKQKIVPGDTMQIECVLAELPRRGVANVECKVFVGGTLACEATIMAQIVKNR